MSNEWSVAFWALLVTLGALLVVLALIAVALFRSRNAASVALERARADAVALRTQVEAIERRLATPAQACHVPDEPEYVITSLGDQGSDDNVPVPVVAGPLFADLVLRESVLQAASLAAGLRRALSPANLNRIRFEMRREIKRARKQRRADLRQAKRELLERERAGSAV